MAKSPAHRLGQIIGDALEATVGPLLADFCVEHGLFLDKKGPRKTRKGKKLTWSDKYENSHDLDFVIERNGADEKVGDPLAFVELAWRRYTKHSKNKAQEIQGAILPLRDKYFEQAPFLGAILAGDFTSPSLKQLKSLGFRVHYVPYKTVVAAFANVGLDISSEEKTPDEILLAKVERWESLTSAERNKAYESFASAIKDDLAVFMQELTDAVTRTVTSIRLLPLFGETISLSSLEDAIQKLEDFKVTNLPNTFVKFEVEIKFANGDKIDAEFFTRERAINFLKAQQVGTSSPRHGMELVKKLIEGLSDKAASK